MKIIHLIAAILSLLSAIFGFAAAGYIGYYANAENADDMGNTPACAVMGIFFLSQAIIEMNLARKEYPSKPLRLAFMATILVSLAMIAVVGAVAGQSGYLQCSPYLPAIAIGLGAIALILSLIGLITSFKSNPSESQAGSHDYEAKPVHWTSHQQLPTAPYQVPAQNNLMSQQPIYNQTSQGHDGSTWTTVNSMVTTAASVPPQAVKQPDSITSPSSRANNPLLANAAGYKVGH